MIVTATDAPIPTEPTPETPAPSGSASVVVSESEAAVIATSPAAAVRVPAIRAVVWMFSISIATEPAIPTAPPPAPLVADAPNVLVPSSVITASSVAPSAITIAADGKIASLLTRT